MKKQDDSRVDEQTVIPPERTTAAQGSETKGATMTLDQVISDPGVTLRDGDVYRFAYSERSWEKARNGLGHGDLNWCFDGQLVVRDGLLCDTYWGLTWGGDSGRHFTVAQALAAGELRFVCNLGEVEKIREDECSLYAYGDAFNLSYQHGCYRYYVKRRGARKNKELMLAALSKRVQDAHHDIERAARNLEWTVRERERLVQLIESGEEPSM